MAEEQEKVPAAKGDAARESKYARFYEHEKNTMGLHFPDVPLDDITKARWEALPAWVKKSVDESGFYAKSLPGPAAPGTHGAEGPPTAPVPRTSPPPGEEVDEDGDPVVVRPIGEKPGGAHAAERALGPGGKSLVERLAGGEVVKGLGASPASSVAPAQAREQAKE